MAVLVSLLASGCQTQLTAVARQKPSSERCLHSSLLHSRFGSEKNFEPAVSEWTGLKGAQGQTERVRIHSHIDSVWAQITDFRDDWDGQKRALIDCPSVSGEKVHACLLPKLH